MNELVEKQRSFFRTGKTKPVEFRRAQLSNLKRVLKEMEGEITQALHADLNKSPYEAYLTEIGIVYSEIDVALKNLKRWTKPNMKMTGLANFPGKSETRFEPYGVVLILSPWNYPFQLAMAPLIGAIAAGNCCICKCSKSSGHTTELIRKIIQKTFPQKYVTCVDSKVSYEAVLEEHYDYIFFTGSERVGKIVMEAASKYVTPVSLELGGKSPCFVDASADLYLAAKRLVWGKLLNAGQTCVAPDYVLIDNKVKAQFIQHIIDCQEHYYGDLCENEFYPKIINEDHFTRLINLIDGEKSKIGGKRDAEKRKIELTLFTEANFESEIMKEEIFGPILPIIGYDSIDEVITQVVERPKPLAFYLFSRNRHHVEKLLSQVSFGGGCVNDVIMHLANHHLPFGGVGSSGMGNYHGAYSFRTFSHEKSILTTYGWLDVPLRYAPFCNKKLNILKKFL